MIKRICGIILLLMLSALLLGEITYSDSLLQAAESGAPEAQYNLGYCYFYGNGVAQDYREAVKWYRLAAEQGYANAQFNLGYSYAHGEGVTQDYREAVKWYRLAAEQGIAEAQYNLGYCYDQGNGVIQNWEEAYFWYLIAAANGSETAKSNRQIIAQLLTSDQIQAIRTRAENWFDDQDAETEKN